MIEKEKTRFLGETVRTVHFVGIGGNGMSALARVLLDIGFTVTGSDLEMNFTAERLSSRGARVCLGHRPEHLSGADIAIYSSAVDENNPELTEARKRGLPVLHRSDLLARLMDLKESVAVAGSHGKTSTAAMITWLLVEAGRQPSFALGGDVVDLESNGGWGEGGVMVAEADESDGTFRKLRPAREVLTGIDLDHVGYYSSRDEVVEAFREFIGRLPAGGSLIVHEDCPPFESCLPEGVKVVTYGLSGRADLRAVGVETGRGGSRFAVEREGKRLGEVELRLLGRCNVVNALAAVAVALEMEISFSTVSRALAAFRGARRRLEIKAEGPVLVVDDYAHHPAEVRAALSAVRQTAPRRLWCVFQPHRYSRVAYFARQLAEALAPADRIILTDLFPAFEEPVPGVSSRLIIDELEKLGRGEAELLRREEVAGLLRGGVETGDAVVIMGPGDIALLVEEVVGALK